LTCSIAILASVIAVTRLSASELTVRELERVPVPEAHQAVAVDAESFYAIASRKIARYAKETNERVAEWTAPADSHILHLNSGLVIDGKLHCANSNWPATPRRNTVEIFEARTLGHLET